MNTSLDIDTWETLRDKVTGDRTGQTQQLHTGGWGLSLGQRQKSKLTYDFQTWLTDYVIIIWLTLTMPMCKKALLAISRWMQIASAK